MFLVTSIVTGNLELFGQYGFRYGGRDDQEGELRADRLLSMMMLLQTKGKMTTRRLAAELGVSRRTVLRDLDALSIAGVPVFAEAGHGGGVTLDERFRTDLTGLAVPEIRSLFVSRDASFLADVGLAGAEDRVILKLLAALPAAQRSTAEAIRNRVLIDPSWWWRDANAPQFWEEMQRAVYEDLKVETTYEHYDGTTVRRVLDPYSLVNKASLWYLIARRRDAFRIYRCSRFHSVRVLGTRFVRASEFSLKEFWSAHRTEFVESVSAYHCTIRIRENRLPFVRSLLPGRWEELSEKPHMKGMADTAHPTRASGQPGVVPAAFPAERWQTLRISLDNELLGKMLVFGLGADAEVVEPASLAASVNEDARQYLERARV